MNIFRNHRKLPSDRYSLGLDIADPKRTVTIPRSAHLAVIGESNSGKGSVIANIISQEVAFGGEIWFIDLKAGMEAENYCNVLARKAYTLEEAYDLLTDFNSNVDTLAAEWRGKTLLELPRVMFGKLEAKTAARLAALKDAGFAGAVVNNPAQLRYTDGWTLYGGLGLNVTNPMSAARYASLGVQGMLLQPETALTAMQAVAPGVPTAALCYGHLPLMLTRACPLRNVRDCGKCPGGGTLRDRKGRDFTVTCSTPGGAGVRTVFNPVPLYMGERLRELPVDVAVAAFTTETPARVSQILDLLFNAQPFDSEFTRGLYYTNN